MNLPRIKELREEKGLTQAGLAHKLGLKQSAVAKWETGGFMPRPATLFALADVLGVSVDELRDREPPVHPPSEAAS